MIKERLTRCAPVRGIANTHTNSRCDARRDMFGFGMRMRWDVAWTFRDSFNMRSYFFSLATSPSAQRVQCSHIVWFLHGLQLFSSADIRPIAFVRLKFLFPLIFHFFSFFRSASGKESHFITSFRTWKANIDSHLLFRWNRCMCLLQGDTSREYNVPHKKHDAGRRRRRRWRRRWRQRRRNETILFSAESGCSISFWHLQTVCAL